MSLVNTPYMSTLERPNRVPAESCVVTGPVMSPRKMELWTCGCSQGVSKHADSGPEEAQVRQWHPLLESRQRLRARGRRRRPPPDLPRRRPLCKQRGAQISFDLSSAQHIEDVQLHVDGHLGQVCHGCERAVDEGEGAAAYCTERPNGVEPPDPVDSERGLCTRRCQCCTVNTQCTLHQQAVIPAGGAMIDVQSQLLAGWSSVPASRGWCAAFTIIALDPDILSDRAGMSSLSLHCPALESGSSLLVKAPRMGYCCQAIIGSVDAAAGACQAMRTAAAMCSGFSCTGAAKTPRSQAGSQREGGQRPAGNRQQVLAPRHARAGRGAGAKGCGWRTAGRTPRTSWVSTPCNTCTNGVASALLLLVIAAQAGLNLVAGLRKQEEEHCCTSPARR